MHIRRVLEARIKTLRAYHTLYRNPGMSEKELREIMIRNAGLELASKLFEFNKVLIKKMDDDITYQLVIDVIVPESQSNGPLR